MSNWDDKRLYGWGRLTAADVRACLVTDPEQISRAMREVGPRGLITYGKGRSYGDVALNSEGQALLTSDYSKIIEFDPETGLIVCEPGVTFNQLLREYLSSGYLAPVTPGTGFATIGGAVANDVHGKNHDKAGSFGDHVIWLDLMLPDGQIERASKASSPELFRATIGGLGLTGFILAVCFKMKPVLANTVDLVEERIQNLDHFFEVFQRARETSTYSVGWIDAQASGAKLGRGIFETAEISKVDHMQAFRRSLKMPFDLPGYVLNATTIGIFNKLYYHRIPRVGRKRRIMMDKFLYPLDSILEWNRIYGKRGFYQFQCVIPESTGYSGIRELLESIVASGSGSFLAVLKTLGGSGLGYLSFPLRGYTLALDFPNKRGTLALMKRLESITLDHGGRIYLAKDACLSATGFATMYPELTRFRDILARIDPECKMKSDLARRLGLVDDEE